MNETLFSGPILVLPIDRAPMFSNPLAAALGYGVRRPRLVITDDMVEGLLKMAREQAALAYEARWPYPNRYGNARVKARRKAYYADVLRRTRQDATQRTKCKFRFA